MVVRGVVAAVLAAVLLGCEAPPEVPQSLNDRERSVAPLPPAASPTGAASSAGWGLYMDRAAALAPHMDREQLREMAIGTCGRLNDNWSMENAAAAMMNSGAGASFAMDYLDLLTASVCATQRDEFEAFVAELDG